MHRAAAVALTLALATPAVADTVHLNNGRKFEEVVAEPLPGAWRIYLPYGEIVLPVSIVERVEVSRSRWQEYRELEAALLARTDASAAEWLQLARWAVEAEFERGVRSAAVRAARLEPSLDGLPALMDELGYRLDEGAGAWLTEEEFMRRRGFVPSNGGWITTAELEERRRAARERETQRREEARQERITRAIEVLAVSQLRAASEPEERPAPRHPAGGRVVAVFPGGFFPFHTVAAPGHDRHRRAGATFADLVGRQPGSLLPVGDPVSAEPPPRRPAPPRRPRHYESRDSGGPSR